MRKEFDITKSKSEVGPDFTGEVRAGFRPKFGDNFRPKLRSLQINKYIF